MLLPREEPGRRGPLKLALGERGGATLLAGERGDTRVGERGVRYPPPPPAGWWRPPPRLLPPLALDAA